MPDDLIRNYQDARRELDSARAKVQEMQRLIFKVGKGLEMPFSFMVSNCSVSLPYEVVSTVGIPTLNAREWLSAEQIAENLANLHSAYRQAQNCWLAIPKADRSKVTPPGAK